MTSEMADRVEYDRLLPDSDRHVWCEWMRHHGIDPDDVCVPGWVERHDADRQVAWLAYSRDEHGRIMWSVDRSDAQREVRVLQLEARPSPWPNTSGEGS